MKKNASKEVQAYLVFGLVTTAVNVGLYWLLTEGFRVPYLAANAMAIVGSILFAYWTNRRYVFHSIAETTTETIREALLFFGSRAFSGFLDMGAMWFLVDVLLFSSTPAKWITQVIVIVVNFVTSKFLVFKQKKNQPPST